MQVAPYIVPVSLPPSNEPSFADVTSSSKTTNIFQTAGSTAKVASHSRTSLTPAPVTTNASKVIVPPFQKPPTRRSNAKFITRVSKDDQDGIPMVKVLEKIAMAKT